MNSRQHVIRQRGMTLLEVAISASILGMVFWAALEGYAGSVRGSAAGTARLNSMANSARAMSEMNLELQEASVRDETVEIYMIDAATGDLIEPPINSTSVPPPDTIYPTPNVVGNNSFALRFMTVGSFTLEADSVVVEEAGPFIYRLGNGDADDYPPDYLLREEQGGAMRPTVLCRGVEQVVFQRDARGGAILITLNTQNRATVNGKTISTRQVLTVTPKNDFSANLANIDMNGEDI